MPLRKLVPAALLLMLLATSVPASGYSSPLAAGRPEPTVLARPHDDHWPLLFVENRGQAGPQRGFVALGGPTPAFFAAEGVTYVLLDPASPPPASRRLDWQPPIPITQERPKQRRWGVQMEFVGAAAGVLPMSEEPAETVVSYFHGRPESWHTGLRTFKRIVYHDLWPGIDLAFDQAGAGLKYEFIVRPGADPRAIRVRYHGADRVTRDEAGRLEVRTPLGTLIDEAPVAWQDALSGSVPVEVAFDTSASSVGFLLGSYDRTLSLVIDPIMLLYGGYIGGAGYDEGAAVAVDSQGCAYVAGRAGHATTSFPVPIGPDVTSNGQEDAFVLKVNAAGDGLVYAGFIGGDNFDYATDIAVDAAGNAYVTGMAGSDESTFPVVGGPGLTYKNGGDAFVAKVNAAGTALVYAGYLGGGSSDEGSSVAVDAQGVAHVAGWTSSVDFPVLRGPKLTYGGLYDAFVSGIDPQGNLVYSGYFGGASNESAAGIAADAEGHIFIAGTTSFDQQTFPIVVGPDLTYNGAEDGYVAKIDLASMQVEYAGYIGGAASDTIVDIALDGFGGLVVAGTTGSDERSFPVLAGPDVTFNGGAYDSFAARVVPSGERLSYCGYLGGEGGEFGAGIAVDAGGNSYMAGTIQGSAAGFPVFGVSDLDMYRGWDEAFLAKVSPAGGLLFAGLIAGDNIDTAGGVAADDAGNAYLTGRTSSDRNTFSVALGPDLTYHGGDADGFIVKIGPTDDIIAARQASTRPTVDGKLVEWLGLSATRLDRTTASSITGSEPNPSSADLSADFRSAWRRSVLYFAVAVTDNVLVGNSSHRPYNDDAIELGMQIPGGKLQQFTLGLDGRQEQNGLPISSLTVFTQTVAGGWTLEATIPYWVLDVTDFKAGEVYSFTFGLWDDDTHSFPSQTHMLWKGTTTAQREESWGDLALRSASYDFDDPPVTATPTHTATTTATATPFAAATLTATLTSTPTLTSTATPTSTPTLTPAATSIATLPPRRYLPLLIR